MLAPSLVALAIFPALVASLPASEAASTGLSIPLSHIRSADISRRAQEPETLYYDYLVGMYFGTRLLTKY